MMRSTTSNTATQSVRSESPVLVRVGTPNSIFGALELPVGYRMTVETRLGSPLLFRYLFGYTVVAVTGGRPIDDVEATIESTFAKYADRNASWVDAPHTDTNPAGSTRRAIREFTWIENGYLPMVSVVACLSDENSSIIVHGSSAAAAGADELATLRGVVESARLP